MDREDQCSVVMENSTCVYDLLARNKFFSKSQFFLGSFLLGFPWFSLRISYSMDIIEEFRTMADEQTYLMKVPIKLQTRSVKSVWLTRHCVN